MNADLQKESTGLRISPPDEEEAPAVYCSYDGNPLAHKTSFDRGDAIRATNAMFGLVPGQEYPILGYWFRKPKTDKEEAVMYVYLPLSANGYNKSFRSAVEEDRTDEEVLLYALPDEITEVCLNDHLQKRMRIRNQDVLAGLEYIPFLTVEVPMKRTYGGQHVKGQEPEDNVIPLHDKKGQFLLFNVA